MSIFYTANIISLGNGCKIPFWHVPWLGGRSPRDIAPKIYECSKRKKMVGATSFMWGCLGPQGKFGE
jgi:hypothetical protein